MTSEEKALQLQKLFNLTGITFALVAMLDRHAAEARKEQVESDIYALWARGGVATPAGLKITIVEAENTIREACLNTTGE